VFVSQVSKRLRESDLIRKAYYALVHTIDNNQSQYVEMEDTIFLENDDDNEGNGDEESSIIDSKLIGRPLFHINLAPVTDEKQVLECLAGRSVRIMQHLHPIILDYLYYHHLKMNYPLRGQTIIEFFTEYKRDGMISITSKLQFFWCMV